MALKYINPKNYKVSLKNLPSYWEIDAAWSTQCRQEENGYKLIKDIKIKTAISFIIDKC